MKHIRTFEEKSNWIKGAIKKPGALRKDLGKDGGKITKSEINQEISKLRKKDKDPSKKGIQGLSKRDSKKYKRLNLAKTLIGMNENMMDRQFDEVDVNETDGELRNYMFFNNLRKMKSEIEEILSLDEKMVDDMICNGHDWADDHISVAKENINHVYNFLTHSEESES